MSFDHAPFASQPKRVSLSPNARRCSEGKLFLARPRLSRGLTLVAIQFAKRKFDSSCCGGGAGNSSSSSRYQVRGSEFEETAEATAGLEPPPTIASCNEQAKQLSRVCRRRRRRRLLIEFDLFRAVCSPVQLSAASLSESRDDKSSSSTARMSPCCCCCFAFHLEQLQHLRHTLAHRLPPTAGSRSKCAERRSCRRRLNFFIAYSQPSNRWSSVAQSNLPPGCRRPTLQFVWGFLIDCGGGGGTTSSLA